MPSPTSRTPRAALLSELVGLFATLPTEARARLAARDAAMADYRDRVDRLAHAVASLP